MPLVEALTLDTPVICSDIPAFHESGQEIPDYIHPIDGRKWMETVIDYCSVDSEMREAQLQRMKGFKPPGWDEHFKQVMVGIEAINKYAFFHVYRHASVSSTHQSGKGQNNKH